MHVSLHAPSRALVCALAAAAASAFAETYSWTGAVDGRWTNAANWAVGGVAAATAPGPADIAVFGACGGATTIDVDGLRAVKAVKVDGAAAPAYTFGASADQVLRFADAGLFEVAADVANMPVFRGGLGVATDQEKGGNVFTLANEAAGELVLGDYGFLTRVPGAPSWAEARLKVTGAGPVRFTRPVSSLGGWQLLYMFYGTGRVTLDANLDNTHGVHFGAPAEVVLNGCDMIFGDVYCDLVAYDDVRFAGTGKVVFKSGNTDRPRDARIFIAGGKTLALGAGIAFANTVLDPRLAGLWTPGALVTGAGTLVMEGTQSAVGGFRLRGGRTRIGRIDQIAAGDRVEISTGATLVYTGAGETFAKTLVLTNGDAAVQLAGAGPLAFATPLVTGAKTGTLTLDNAGADAAVWSATETAALPVALKGAWRLAGSLAHAPVTLAQGASLVLESAAAQPVGELGLNGQTVDFGAHAYRMGIRAASGANTLKAPAGTTLTALAGEAGTLDVVADERAVAVAGATAGAAPAWLTLNGRRAGFDAAGRLVYATYDATAEIAARGGVVPAGDPAAVVGVTRRGETGAVTLEADAVTVAALVQKVDVPAVVELAAGQTLTAGTLARTAGSAALEIGAEKGTGTLAAGADGVVFDNPTAEAAIRVRAALAGTAAQTLAKAGAGTVVFDNAFAWPGRIDLPFGELRVVDPASPHAAALFGQGVYTLDGAGTRTLAGSAEGFAGTFRLAGGVTRIKNAAALGGPATTLVVTNGAALDLSGGLEGTTFNNLVLGTKSIFLAGDGPDGLGALRPEAFDPAAGGEAGATNQGWNVISGARLTLMGDATIGSPGQTRWNIKDTVFDQQGHTLTFANKGRIGLFESTVTNAGPVVLAAHEKGEEGGLCFGAALFGAADAPPITAHGGTHFTWQSAQSFAQVRPLEILGATTFYNFHAYNNTVADTGYNGWAGPVRLVDADARLTLHVYNQSARALRLDGPVSGAGGLRMNGSGRYYVMNPTNTFSGALDCSGTNWGVWEFGWAGSIPDYSKATFGTGVVALASDDTNRWPMAAFAKFMNEAHFLDGKTSVGFDTTFGDQRLVLDNLVVTNTAYDAIRNLGPGRLVVEGPGIFPGALKLDVTGVVEVTGAAHVALTNRGDQMTLRPRPDGWTSLLHFRGAADVEMPSASYYVGAWNTNYCAQVRIEGSRLYNPALLGAPCQAGQLVVGAVRSQGVVEIAGDASVVSNRVVLGLDGGVGALCLRGGALVDLGPVSSAYGNVGESGGYGYLEQTGGTLDFVRSHRVGFRAHAQNGPAYGVVALLGGRAASVPWTGETVSSLNLGVDGAHGHLYLKGGSLEAQGGLSFGEHNAGHRDGFGTVTLEDGASLLQHAPLMMGVSPAYTAVLNLNGGVLEATCVCKAFVWEAGSPSEADGSWAGSKGYVNFNGGTLRLRDVAQERVFASDQNPRCALDRITVFAGGATLDTNGRDRTLGTPLQAPEGNGVVALDTTGILGRDWIAPPYIEIENEEGSAGFGATVYADFDSAARRVTGVRVVSPGCRYTKARAVVRYGIHACFTNAVTLGASPSGGLTKTGAGTLTLACANTFAGAVAVEGGTLKVAADGALPAKAPVSVAPGATLDLNGRALAATALGTTGGAVVNGTLTLPSALAVDLAEAKRGNCPTFAGGAFAFPEGATLTLAHADVRDARDRFYTLFKVTGAGTLTGTPTFVAADDLAPWTLVNTGRELRLAFPAGSVFILR